MYPKKKTTSPEFTLVGKRGNLRTHKTTYIINCELLSAYQQQLTEEKLKITGIQHH